MIIYILYYHLYFLYFERVLRRVQVILTILNTKFFRPEKIVIFVHSMKFKLKSKKSEYHF